MVCSVPILLIFTEGLSQGIHSNASSSAILPPSLHPAVCRQLREGAVSQQIDYHLLSLGQQRRLTTMFVCFTPISFIILRTDQWDLSTVCEREHAVSVRQRASGPKESPTYIDRWTSANVVRESRALKFIAQVILMNELKKMDRGSLLALVIGAFSS